MFHQLPKKPSKAVYDKEKSKRVDQETNDRNERLGQLKAHLKTQINQTIIKKEENAMNVPQPKAPEHTTDNQPQNQNQGQPQARVDNIPGNFQRPGQPAPQAANAPGRPVYPGSYPGANTPSQSYSEQGAGEPGVSTGRKLVIGQGITLSGEIEACDHLIVEGTVEAALKGASQMDVSESGAFYGAVEIDEAVIAGHFEGDLTVKGRLTIRSSGTITGTIAYKELAIEAGAVLDGTVTPLDGKSAGANVAGKAGTKAKGKVQQDNASELPFADKGAA